MNFFHSIKFKFTLWYLVVLGIALGAMSTGAYFSLSHNLHRNLDETLEIRSTQLSTVRDLLLTMSGDYHTTQAPEFQDQLQIMAEDKFEEEIGEIIYLYVKFSEDELIYLSPNNLDTPVGLDLVPQAIEGQSIFATVETDDGDIRIFATPFFLRRPPFMPDETGALTPVTPGNDTISAVLVVGRPMDYIDQSLSRLLITLLIAVPLTLLAAGGGGIFLAGRALKPVEEMTRKAQEIEEKDLSQRIKIKTKDELGKLGSTLNQMIERLEKAFKRQQQFTGDASHELRAPLAVIQAESTLALQKERTAEEYRRSLENIAVESNRMSMVIDQLLELARADAGKSPLKLEEINLGNLLKEMGSDAEILCRDKGLEFQLNPPENLTISGDILKLRALLWNLIDNAIRYTPEGGTISLALSQKDDMAVVSVSDTGSGIAAEDLPLIFERFYRVDKSRSRAEGGSGLGLSIARHTAEAHKGRIEVQSQEGKGSTFHVWLPLTRNS